jgi:hypothetical protein
MVTYEPLKPSIFFTDIEFGGNRRVWQYEDVGFTWVMTVKEGKIRRVKARGYFMTREQALVHKLNYFDQGWRQVNEEEAIKFLFPDQPTTINEDAW